MKAPRNSSTTIMMITTVIWLMVLMLVTSSGCGARPQLSCFGNQVATSGTAIRRTNTRSSMTTNGRADLTT